MSHPNRQPRTAIPPTLQAKLAAFQANRQSGNPSSNNVLNLETAMQSTTLAGSPPQPPFPKPPPGLAQRINNLKGGPGIAGRRPKPAFSLRDIDPNLVQPSAPGGGPPPAVGGLGISGAGLGAGRPAAMPSGSSFSTPFSNFSKIVDPSGALNFNGKAILHSSGVNFENGASFTINMDQLQLDDEELGKGNYGTVKKVLHKPTNVAMAMKEIRLELDQAKLNAIIMELDVLHRAVAPEIVEFYGAFFIESCVYYCMEYMDAGSLDKLITSAPSTMHLSKPAPPPPPPQASTEDMDTDPSSEYSFSLPFEEEEVDFDNDDQYTPFNAAFNKRDPNCSSHVYNGGPIPETVLGRIAGSMVRGLKFLKDELNIMHRDVKPTNVLINRKGEVKLCDFGVSGQLDQSMARTNIGCQSYMAPERIRGESRVVTAVASSDATSPTTAAAMEANGVPGTANLADKLYGAYTVSSDVWSLGLSVIELGLGRYPYPPETYSNVFAQLTAIVHGPPPCLPSGPPPAVLTCDPSADSSSTPESTAEFQQQLEANPFITTPGKPRPGYSPFARDFVNKCMRKEPAERASYKQLLEHPWLVRNAQEDVDMVGWVRCAMAAKDRARGRGR